MTTNIDQTKVVVLAKWKTFNGKWANYRTSKKLNYLRVRIQDIGKIGKSNKVIYYFMKKDVVKQKGSV